MTNQESGNQGKRLQATCQLCRDDQVAPVVAILILLCWFAEGLWSTIAGAIDGSSPVAAESAAMASAALCSVMPASSHAIVTEVVQKLRRGMDCQ